MLRNFLKSDCIIGSTHSEGSVEYEGRVLKTKGHNVFKAQYEIKQLRRQLETAIGDENFEEAAQIRDKIKALESKVDSKEKLRRIVCLIIY